jgi:hypothetical protein
VVHGKILDTIPYKYELNSRPGPPWLSITLDTYLRELQIQGATVMDGVSRGRLLKVLLGDMLSFTEGAPHRIVYLRHITDDILAAILEADGSFPVDISSVVRGKGESERWV